MAMGQETTVGKPVLQNNKMHLENNSADEFFLI